MKCFRLCSARRNERCKVYETILNQSSDLLSIIDRRAPYRKMAGDKLHVRVLERDMRINILKFNSSVMRAGMFDKLLYGDEMKDQMAAIERRQHKILSLSLVNHCL